MQVVPGAIGAARSSLLIEQQYIHGIESLVTNLCSAIADAVQNNPGLDVRIILAPPFSTSAKDRASLERDLATLANNFNLATGTNVRLLSHRFFTHLHNKLVIIDDSRVLISSQNWSTSGVSENREAGLLIDYPDLARYYRDIFELDWQTASQSLAEVQPHMFLTVAPVGAANIVGGPAIRMTPGDFAEV